MKKNLLIIFLQLGILLSASAQTGSIKGYVLDKESSEPLIGATVVLKGTKLGVITNFDGLFEFASVKEGNYTVAISYVGYESKEFKVSLVEGADKDLGNLKLEESAMGLSEVEIFASVVEDRKTPIAISALNAKDIDERYSGESMAEVLNNTPGVYAIQGSGGYGDNEVYIRGFNQTNVAFLVNGIPVNDMENGRMFWSNFAGLSEVTRQVQVQRGLGASKLAISSIGGTVNMITKPAERSEGGKIEYQMGTGSWNQRTRFTYNTGESSNGWAVSFQGSRTTTSGALSGLSGTETGSVVSGAFTDAWAYYLAVSKKINDKHQLMFWGFGAPVNRGTAWVADDATRANFNIQDLNFNNALGIYQGEIINARQNKVNKPLAAFSHYWDIDRATTLSTSVYFSHAKVYSTQPNDAESSLFFPERSPSNPAFTPNNLINWDYLGAQNRSAGRLMTIENPNGDANAEPITGYASQYFMEARYNNHNWIGMISNFKKNIRNFSVLAGVDLRHYKGSHYAKVFDLFGGDFVLNESSFGDDYNKLQINEVARVGDKITYDYDGIVNWLAGFGQLEYSLNKFDIFATATLTSTSYTRVGNFWNSRDIYNYNSVGQSETERFITYTTKAGINFRPTNRHNIYANGGHFTRPPFMANSFADARYSNLYRDGLTTEKITSMEVGYGYRSSKFSGNVNAYIMNWTDRTTTFEHQEQIDQNSDIQQVFPISLTGLVSLHKGLEVDVKYNLFTSLELNGFLSLGDWQWDNNVSASIVDEDGTVLRDVTLNIKGLPVASAAQTTIGLGLHYSGIRNTYVGTRLNYADRIPVNYSPEDLIEGFITRDVIEAGFPSYYLLNIYAGRYFDIGDNMNARLSASVQNVTNEGYVRWASYFFNDVQRAYGYPRTFTIGLSIEF